MLRAYLADELTPSLQALGFTCEVFASPVGKTPFMIATRIEAEHLPTLLSYGHSNVVRRLEQQCAQTYTNFSKN